MKTLREFFSVALFVVFFFPALAAAESPPPTAAEPAAPPAVATPAPSAVEPPAPAAVAPPATAAVNPPATAVCDNIPDADRKNVCNVKSFDKEKMYGYENKDHRNYYCSLVKNRDMQTLCYAIVSGKPSSCDLIVDPEIEKECRASIQ